MPTDKDRCRESVFCYTVSDAYQGIGHNLSADVFVREHGLWMKAGRVPRFFMSTTLLTKLIASRLPSSSPPTL